MTREAEAVSRTVARTRKGSDMPIRVVGSRKAVKCATAAPAVVA